MARCLALAASAVAGYLAWVSVQSQDAMFGCGGTPLLDCEFVLASRWSSWLGVPVSFPAAGVYTLIFTALLLVGPKTPPRVRRGAWLALIPLLTMAVGAALWFVTLLLVIKKFCLYCLLVHGCGLSIAGIVLTRLPTRPAEKSDRAGTANVKDFAGIQTRGDSRRLDATMLTMRAAWWLGALGLLGPTMLIAGQLVFPPKQIRVEPLGDVARSQAEPFDKDAPSGNNDAEKPESESENGPAAETSNISGPEDPLNESVSIVDGTIRLDTHYHPILGDPDAKYVVVKLFDYSCKDCRRLHFQLERARRRYGDQLAIVVLPVPLNVACNKYVTVTHSDHRNACVYAKLALAVWALAPEKFEEFHHWLFKLERPPEPSRAESHAAAIVGRAALEQQLEGTSLARQLNNYIRLQYQSGGHTLPRMIIGKHVIKGKAADAEEVFDLLQRLLKIAPLKGP